MKTARDLAACAEHFGNKVASHMFMWPLCVCYLFSSTQQQIMVALKKIIQ